MRPSTSRPCNVEQRPVLQLHEVEKNRTENFRSASRDQEKGAVIPFQKSLSLHQQSLRISCICNKNNSKRRIAQKTMGGTFSRGNQNVGKNGRLSDAYFMAFFAKLRANRVQSVTSRPTVSLRHFQYDAVPFAIPVMALFCGQFLSSRIIVRFAEVSISCFHSALRPFTHEITKSPAFLESLLS